MAQNDRTKGVWIVTTPEGNVIPEHSELAGLRTAVATAGKLEFVKYGDALGNPSPEAPAPKAAKPKPEPAPKPVPQPEPTPAADEDPTF